LRFPVVDGLSGSGKTRLLVEVVRKNERRDLAHAIVVLRKPGDLDATRERDGNENQDILAKVLFDAFIPGTGSQYKGYSLLMVMKKIQADLKAKLVVLQIDEYARSPSYTRALIRACYSVFARENKDIADLGILVYPMLSGITSLTLVKGLLEISGEKTEAHFFSLTGLDEAGSAELAKVVKKTLKWSEKDIYLDTILDTFGGVPRFYEFCIRAMNELKISRSCTKDEAAQIYNKTLGLVEHRYTLMNWSQWFTLSPRDPGEESRIAQEHLKVLHTIAAAGVQLENALERVEFRVLISPPDLMNTEFDPDWLQLLLPPSNNASCAQSKNIECLNCTLQGSM